MFKCFFFFCIHGAGRHLMGGVMLTSPVVHLTNNITVTTMLGI